MIRRLLVPALAASLLAGCATGYQYRSGPGDYYYGQPEVEYRDYGYSGYGYPYSYYRGGYGYPYGYYGPYRGYWGSWWWHRRPGGHRDHHHDHDRDHSRGDGDRPPWRNIGILPDRDGDQPRLRERGPAAPTLPPRRADLPQRPPRPSLPPRRVDGDSPRPMAPSVPPRPAAVDRPSPVRPALPSRQDDADRSRRASPPSVRSNPPERELRRRNQP